MVTTADHAAEDLIVQALRAERPEDSIVGEEGADHVGTSGRTWVIDPVDGTKGFLRRDQYAVAFALIASAEDRDPVEISWAALRGQDRAADPTSSRPEAPLALQDYAPRAVLHVPETEVPRARPVRIWPTGTSTRQTRKRPAPQ